MKAKEVRDMTADDLRAKEVELKKELFNLRMRAATGQVENQSRLRTVRRDIARVKTIVAEKARGAK